MKVIDIQTHPDIGLYVIGKETHGKKVFIKLSDIHLKILLSAYLEKSIEKER
jgi:hypothetical protein